MSRAMTLFSGFARPRQTEPRDLAHQRSQRDAEELGGAPLVAAEALQRLRDALALSFIVGPRWAAGARFRGRGGDRATLDRRQPQVTRLDDRGRREENGALDHVAKL